MSATFTRQDGSRSKSASHAAFYYHTKDRPLLVRFKGKTGDGKYGPYAVFEVDGDPGEDYFYKPAKNGQDHEAWWPFMEAQLQAAANKWMLVTAQYEGDVPTLNFEDAEGNVVQQAAQAFDAEPVNQRALEELRGSLSGPVRTPAPVEATGSPLQSDEELFRRCAILAGNVVNAFGDAHKRAMSDVDQRIATTLFIEARRNR